jgi:hypothetical protein
MRKPEGNLKMLKFEGVVAMHDLSWLSESISGCGLL